MLVDFGDIKRTVQRWIDENLDHNMLLRRDDPILPFLQAQGERVFVMDVNPTAENIARLIFERTAAAGLPVIEVVLWETPNCHAAYSGPPRRRTPEATEAHDPASPGRGGGPRQCAWPWPSSTGFAAGTYEAGL